jgi:hypothetical protein
MGRKHRREIIWLIVSTVLTLVAYSGLFGSRFLSTPRLYDQVPDIQFGDTYLVVEPINYFLSLLAIFVFAIYLPRVLLNRFDNSLTNIIFLSSNGYLILLLALLLPFLPILIATPGHFWATGENWIITPALESENVFRQLQQQTRIRMFLIFVEVSLIVLFGVTAFYTGRGSLMYTSEELPE